MRNFEIGLAFSNKNVYLIIARSLALSILDIRSPAEMFARSSLKSERNLFMLAVDSVIQLKMLRRVDKKSSRWRCRKKFASKEQESSVRTGRKGEEKGI